MNSTQGDLEAPPVIGIVAHRIRLETKARPADGQYGDYCLSLIMAGAAPVLIPLGLPESALQAVYERLGGLLLPGGGDVAPALYGQEPHPALGTVDEALDETELLLARWALANRLPILAICRGIQLLNVAAGGTLYQDIPALIPGALAHACPDTPEAHTVRMEPESRLSSCLGCTSCLTNSRHHQAVRDVAPGMVVTARTDDGIIEGIELPDAPFIVGVQWHPENLAPQDPRMLGLFKAFVEAGRLAVRGGRSVRGHAFDGGADRAVHRGSGLRAR